MNPDTLNVIELIPQRPPMQMIDRLVSVTEKGGKGSLMIRADNLFVENDRLSESAMVEFIAQTAAAFTGYKKSGHLRSAFIGHPDKFGN
jgi:predicted hotdog family 3-hydroxylacyl-ACP dehydratase